MREWEFDVDDRTLRGKRWGSTEGKPVLALHGWLDNCASFDFLAPLLTGVDLLAIDLAGQGRSDHRRHFGAYNIWHDIAEVIAVADQLGWQEFSLLGHSRGAMISTLIAGTFPERVKHLALIESFAPQVIEPEKTPEQMALSIKALLSVRNKDRSAFDSFDDAVKAREKGFLRLDHPDALALAKRGVAERDGKYYWDNDIRLNIPSEVKFTREQARAFTDRITIPISLVIGRDGLSGEFPELNEFIEDTSNLSIHYLEGDHHLHMSNNCQEVAATLNEYFAA